MSELSHIDPEQRPAMVDVGNKAVTRREAIAVAHLRFPAEVARTLHDAHYQVAKGSIIDTAIIAGTMAVKRTHELIPFCHPVPIDACRIEIDWQEPTRLRIRCTARAEYRTGIEMEALTGAGLAALTVYDMCKALSHEIVIEDIRLLAKSGGKRTVAEGRTLA
ncbi:cyclic pyranopterin monophosphate synthase MoaC [Pseudomarimonas arenosa]|uniref:cyclic pyranopterin monophosphate synthase n=1 Tax=Pseudomarimonas arenosa TaxID=2774145 RepID=A0AAW3ZMB3_9GAMM|nr:cyclic pyranopterin monophosphate synthase MoaC [Pseudomarimonas arenosa]MBD8526030.1 cyclic pyranopterin monophosphate synthase MoaC [Pseudomarimonas arenosa]